MNLANLASLAKIGAATFAGAFFGALTLTAVPTTLDGWKVVLAPALGAAIASEVVFLRAQLSAFLAAAAAAATGFPALAPAGPTTPAAAAQPAAVLAKASTPPPAARGFVSLGVIVMLVCFSVVVMMVASLVLGCGPSATTSQVEQKILTTVPADLTATECIANTDETDSAKGYTVPQIVADELVQCSPDIATIVSELGHKVANDMVTGRISQGNANIKLAAIYQAGHFPAPHLLVMPGHS